MDRCKRIMARRLEIKNERAQPYVGKHNYSAICAVYGVENYLEDFFISIENQTLDFRKHVELVMVDDGSLDNSASIIKKWASKYPKNIKYVKKENGGQASARNFGLRYASYDWVTFIDPDDFVDKDYFKEVDRFISEHPELTLVSCNFIFYFEDKDQYSDTHPLKYRFKNNSIFDVSDLNNHIQLSVNSAFFRKKEILKQSLEMSSLVKPSFEDAHFVNKYLLAQKQSSVAFIKNARYYYRKRSDASSTLDGAWADPMSYSDKLEYGTLDLLLYAKKIGGTIPNYVQRAVLYDYMWNIRFLLNNDSKLSFLTAEQQLKFLNLSKKIFSCIDIETINAFNLAGCWTLHKVGITSLLKGAPQQFFGVSITDFDASKSMLKLKYFYYGDTPLELFCIGDEDTIPIYVKDIIHSYVGNTFAKERIVWLPVRQGQQNLTVSISNKKIALYYAGKQHLNGVSINSAIEHFKKKVIVNHQNLAGFELLIREQAKSETIRKKYRNSWLFMDRDSQADDNAEHLYRYVAAKYPERNIYFVLSKKSSDWNRIAKEGFKLLNFNSTDHKLALLNADHLISSHADHYVVSLLDQKKFGDLLHFKFTFLQHGVTQNDLSTWLNSKTIDLFLTTTPPEYDSISGSFNNYKFTPKEVSLTGFPRHDSLLNLNSTIENEKLILIMPTWRSSLVGKSIGGGTNKEINENFYSSEFAQTWKSLLHSKKLKELTGKHGYKVVFFPHTNIQDYLEWFEIPNYIEPLSHDCITSMQNLFCRAATMITDYSSVAFEMAYLNKSILYYQFDHDFVFGNGHTINEGYFDYTENGFGPVCYDENELLKALEHSLKRDTQPDKEYSDRIENTFPQRDGMCCQRVYDAICKLHEPLADSEQETIMYEYAERAIEQKNFPLAISRWENIYELSHGDDKKCQLAALSLARACRISGDLIQASRYIDEIKKNYPLHAFCDHDRLVEEEGLLTSAYCSWVQDMQFKEKARSFMDDGNWQEAINSWNKISTCYSEQSHSLLIYNTVICNIALHMIEEAKTNLALLEDLESHDNESPLFQALVMLTDKNYISAYNLLSDSADSQITSAVRRVLSIIDDHIGQSSKSESPLKILFA